MRNIIEDGDIQELEPIKVDSIRPFQDSPNACKQIKETYEVSARYREFYEDVPLNDPHPERGAAYVLVEQSDITDLAVGFISFTRLYSTIPEGRRVFTQKKLLTYAFNTVEAKGIAYDGDRIPVGAVTKEFEVPAAVSEVIYDTSSDAFGVISNRINRVVSKPGAVKPVLEDVDFDPVINYLSNPIKVTAWLLKAGDKFDLSDPVELDCEVHHDYYLLANGAPVDSLPTYTENSNYGAGRKAVSGSEMEVFAGNIIEVTTITCLGAELNRPFKNE